MALIDLPDRTVIAKPGGSAYEGKMTDDSTITGLASASTPLGGHAGGHAPLKCKKTTIRKSKPVHPRLRGEDQLTGKSQSSDVGSPPDRRTILGTEDC